MLRMLTSILTFTIGVFTAFGVERLLMFDTDLVATVELTTALPSYRNAEKTPKYVAFFDSFDEGEYYSAWFIPKDDFKGFRDMPEVWTILLSLEEEGGRKKWTAIVLTKNPDHTPNDVDTFISTNLKSESDRLSFETVKIRGIQYKFDGRFLYGGSSFTDGERVLSGTISKLTNNKVVSKFTDDFNYYEPQCYH